MWKKKNDLNRSETFDSRIVTQIFLLSITCHKGTPLSWLLFPFSFFFCHHVSNWNLFCLTVPSALLCHARSLDPFSWKTDILALVGKTLPGEDMRNILMIIVQDEIVHESLVPRGHQISWLLMFPWWGKLYLDWYSVILIF